jgi:hypothetical protein
MKTFSCLAIVCALIAPQAQAQPAATNQSGVQLTVELRDGSRVVGKSLEETMGLHSFTLGDLKLPWSSIRSIEYAGTNNEWARLTATYGDVFAVTLAGGVLRVETGFGQTEFPVKLIRSVKVSPGARFGAAAGTGAARLAIELRDGSHVVGKSLDDTWSFHSLAMGDLKLNWAGIRSIEYEGTNTEMARLTATNGDVYEVQFDAAAVRVESGFGKTELPVKLIRSVRVIASRDDTFLTDGLAAYYPFHGDANDASGNGNNGVVHGAALDADRFGNPNSAYRFDGIRAYIEVPASPQFDTENRTISFWMKPMSWLSPRPWVNLISKDNEQPGQREWGVQEKETGQIRADDFTSSGEHILDSAGTVGKGQWHHVAVVWDGTTEQTFIDGTFDSSLPDAGALVVVNTPVRIGANPFPGNQNFCGSLGDIRIYKRALSPSEVQALYQEESNGGPQSVSAAVPDSGSLPAYDSTLIRRPPPVPLR